MTIGSGSSKISTPSWCPAASGKRGVDGMINSIRYARENKVLLFRHLPRDANHGH